MQGAQLFVSSCLRGECVTRPDIPRADAYVIGAGPNGLAAGIRLAQAGVSVVILEAEATIGGACRSAELTLPGFTHDLGASVFPLGAGSPFFRTLPLEQFGLEWIQPDAPVAHPLDGGDAVVLERSLAATAESLGEDAEAYWKLLRPIVEAWDGLDYDVLSPPHWPLRPIAFAKFGLAGIWSLNALARADFRNERTRALLAGIAAHSMLPLDALFSGAFGLLLAATAHAVGWPIARGGAQRLTNALAQYFTSLGGTIVRNCAIDSLDELPPARLILCDVTPHALLRLAGSRLPAKYRAQLMRWRYEVGAFKMDWALDGPIPWTNPEVARAGTVHVGGSWQEIAACERAATEQRAPERPAIILAQHTLFDSTRAPAGKHTAWGYCHVPAGSREDMSARIEAQIERFAPGFRDRILARSVLAPHDLERHDRNLVGGHINGGLPDLWQIFVRPSLQFYRTPARGVYLCSSSTPPGGGVHGMCGFHAAEWALHDLGLRAPYSLQEKFR